MKNVFRFLSLGLIMAIFTGCSARSVAVPEGYVVIDSNNGYYKIPDYKAANVPEILTGIPDNSFQGYAPATDGLFILQFADKDDSTPQSKTGTTDKIPVVKKFNKNGKLLWTKRYVTSGLGDGSGKLAAYQDGFVLAVEKYPYNMGQLTDQKGIIIRCDKEGNLLWQKEIEDYTGRMFSNLFITDAGDIVTIGNWKAEDGKQVAYDAPEDIVFTKFNDEGEMVLQKSFGNSDFENLLDAAYAKDIGFVLNYYTRIDSLPVNMLTCFDENFNLVSIYKGAGKEHFGPESIIIADGYIYQAGVKYTEAAGDEQEDFLLKLDKTGRVIWREGSKSRVITAITLLNNGNLTVCGVEGDENYIRIIDPDGKTLFEATSKKDSAWTTLYPVKDGGFITIDRRIIRNIPQPAYLSSIWYDTEIMAARYDQELNLIWRKTYNRYIDVTTQDFVYPTIDGRLLVE